MKTHSGLDASYRLACLAIILLWGAIWWTGFLDILRAGARWLGALQ